MQCIATVRMAVAWNGRKLDWFRPSRGIRQGDPISPYLFVPCLERLGHLINQAVQARAWKPIKLSKYGPFLSHLFLLMTYFFLLKLNYIRVCCDDADRDGLCWGLTSNGTC